MWMVYNNERVFFRYLWDEWESMGKGFEELLVKKRENRTIDKAE